MWCNCCVSVASGSSLHCWNSHVDFRTHSDFRLCCHDRSTQSDFRQFSLSYEFGSHRVPVRHKNVFPWYLNNCITWRIYYNTKYYYSYDSVVTAGEDLLERPKISELYTQTVNGVYDRGLRGANIMFSPGCDKNIAHLTLSGTHLYIRQMCVHCKWDILQIYMTCLYMS